MSEWSNDFRVELRRHIGVSNKPPFGLLPVELAQKRVLVYGPNLDRPIECGILPDRAGAPLLWLPERRETVKDTPGLVEWIEGEALRLKAAGEFVDPPPASYFKSEGSTSERDQAAID